MCVRARVPNSMKDREVEQHAREKSGEKGKRLEAWESDAVGNMGLDFRP